MPCNKENLERTKIMMKRIRTIIPKSTRSSLCLLLLGTLGASVTSLAAPDDPHAGHGGSVPAKLVQAVRNATAQFTNVNTASAAGYQPLFGCVSGPDQGAMGVHYINLALYSDGKLDETQPEALIYEPLNGTLVLVGAEYIVDAAAWLSQNTSPPMLEGQAFQLVTSPNRFGLPAFFELHVWAWRDSPNGTFADWNTGVTCERQ
jgi:hypothetical protein